MFLQSGDPDNPRFEMSVRSARASARQYLELSEDIELCSGSEESENDETMCPAIRPYSNSVFFHVTQMIGIFAGCWRWAIETNDEHEQALECPKRAFRLRLGRRFLEKINVFFTTKNLQLVYPPLWQGPFNENPYTKLRLGRSKLWNPCWDAEAAGLWLGALQIPGGSQIRRNCHAKAV